MKVKLYIIILALSSLLLWSDEQILDYFNAKSDGSSVTIEWKSNSENHAARYELERSSTKTDFKRITTKYTQGNNSYYKYVDNEAFLKDKTNEVAQEKTIFSYRLKIIKKDNSYSYSDVVYVTHDINSIRRTWGMIKEMFR